MGTRSGVEAALRIASAVWFFWRHRGYCNEGRRWVEDALARDVVVPLKVRAKAFQRAAELACAQGDYRAARLRFEQALTLWRQVDDTAGLASALPRYERILTRTATTAEEYRAGTTLLDEAIVLNRSHGNQWMAGYALILAAVAAIARLPRCW